MKNTIPELLSQREMSEGDLLKAIEKKGYRVHQGYFNDVKNGNRWASLRLAFAISLVFNKSIEDIFLPTREEIYGGKE